MFNKIVEENGSGCKDCVPHPRGDRSLWDGRGGGGGLAQQAEAQTRAVSMLGQRQQSWPNIKSAHR